MKKKHTYKPNNSVSYAKGGKNKRVYKDKDFKKGEVGRADFFSAIADLLPDLASIFAINQQGSFLEQLQEDYGDLGDTVDTGMLEFQENVQVPYAPTGAGSNLTDFAEDIPGLVTKQKPISTDFAENQQDILERQTSSALTNIGKTGNPNAGLKNVLDSAATAELGIGKEVAGMKLQENQQEQERQKFLASLQGQTETAISGQDLDAESTLFSGAANNFGDITSAWGDLQGSLIAAESAIVGQEAQAWGDFAGSLALAIGDAVPFKEGGKVKEYDKGGTNSKFVDKDGSMAIGAKEGMKEYNEGGEQSEMMPAGEADVSPGEFSHDSNPIDIVQKRSNGEDEKIGEMTGGEAIMPPDDVQEFEMLISEGDKDAVFNKLKGLFVKWDAKTKAHREKNLDQNAMGGAKMGYRPTANLNY
mgnify:CR=1 FL=1|tara:strand:+ start:8041 stop:9291 length:1251 start_codon:yes stop_codon:yes gene_type:complete